MSPCRTLEGLNGKMCELLHTSAVVQKKIATERKKAPASTFGWGSCQSGSTVEIRPSPRCTRRAEHPLVALTSSGDLFISAKDLFVPAMVTTDGRQELRRRLICCLVVQLDGMREIIRRKRPQRLSHGRLRKLTGKFSGSCGQFFVVVRS